MIHFHVWFPLQQTQTTLNLPVATSKIRAAAMLTKSFRFVFVHMPYMHDFRV
jgi:hypothetical protein